MDHKNQGQHRNEKRDADGQFSGSKNRMGSPSKKTGSASSKEKSAEKR